MRVVIDASIVLAVIIDEPERMKILEKTTDVELIAPRSLPWEIGNALAAMLKRRRLNMEQAFEALRLYDQIRIHLVDISIGNALRLAGDLQIYAYDAYMIECARSSGSDLFALDRGLNNAARQAGVAVWEITS